MAKVVGGQSPLTAAFEVERFLEDKVFFLNKKNCLVEVLWVALLYMNFQRGNFRLVDDLSEAWWSSMQGNLGYYSSLLRIISQSELLLQDPTSSSGRV